MNEIMNKKGFIIGDKVKVKRDATKGDYRWMAKAGEVFTKAQGARYILQIGKIHTITKVYTMGVRISNHARVPNHLLIKV